MYLYPADIDSHDPRDYIDTCPLCEGTGWREGRSHFDAASYDYCICTTGKEQRERNTAQLTAEWQVAGELWDRPNDWPW